MSATLGSEQSEENPLDGLIRRLQQKVAERKLRGEYPEELMEQLDEHFKRMASHRPERDNSYLFRELASVETSSRFTQADVSLESGVPGGAKIHSIIQRAISRQTDGILQQTQRFADDVCRLLNSVVLAVQDGATHTHPDLVGRLDAVLERLTSYERAPLDNGAAVADLRRRVEQLEAAEAASGFNPWFNRDDFEQDFRGSKDELLARYRDLAEGLKDVVGPVVDFGCGRGEFMSLLKVQGNEVWGIESDPALAKLAQADGFSVQTGDGVAILGNASDASLGAITVIQAIERLTKQQQLNLVAMAYAKLRPGGKLVIEAMNPQSLYAHAHAASSDPRLISPVHPQYLQFLQEQIGFNRVEISWRNSPSADDQLEPTGDDKIDRNVERLNRLLFAASDYATIATK